MKRIVLLGATGSIGDNTLQVIRKHPDKLKLIGIAAHSKVKKLAAIAKEFAVPNIGIYDKTAYNKTLLGSQHKLFLGNEGLRELSFLKEADIIVFGLNGTSGLKPALAALEAGKAIAIANKEILVLGGRFLMEASKKNNTPILPLDSEHNGIFQCLQGIHNVETIQKVLLTASGGYFRDWPLEKLKEASPQEAIQHPNWQMGPKVTVDCATVANKGLELIEAQWLFDLRPTQLDALLHPQSKIHALIQLSDGSILSQMSPPSMTFPIQYALFYPERYPSVEETMDFSLAQQLELQPIDPARYPCYFLAKQALASGGSYSEAFNAANEVAVQAFLRGKINFLDIARIIEKVLSSGEFNKPAESINQALQVDILARNKATELIN